MSTTMEQKTVFVGLSGGVDSSVAALRLKQAGHRVVGVFIKVWQPDFLVCDWEKERLDAMRVAAHLDIPFLTFDAEDAYKRDVADYMIAEYKAGRTPNPDVMCNQHVKFGVFLEFALAHGADAVATGHYARMEERGGTHHLLRGTDPEKDQSYFLWTLTEKQRAHILFPVGDTKKPDIRAEAARAGIPTFAKSDSQGICFLGHVDIQEFLAHYVSVEPGAVLNEQGERIGTHNGAIFYTIGQRHGFTLHEKGTLHTPHDVIDKDCTKNTIVVSSTPRTFSDVSGTSSHTITLTSVNAIGEGFNTHMEAQFRYRQRPFSVTLVERENDHAILSVPDAKVEIPSRGQSCVLYRGDICLGGGIIS